MHPPLESAIIFLYSFEYYTKILEESRECSVRVAKEVTIQICGA